MATGDWHRMVDEAAALGTTTIQLIGGEPLLRPDVIEIAEHALRAGLRVRVYTNLVRVRDKHWRLFERSWVSVACSYYSGVAAEHDKATGREGSHRATRANIAEAVQRGVRLRVAILDAGDHERAERARAEMENLGVREVHVDRVRPFGNAAGASPPDASALCGRCGDQRAAVLPDGQVAVCEMGRHLTAGSVAGGASLASVLGSGRWAATTASVPRRTGAHPCAPDCEPSASDSCAPAKAKPCGPLG